MGGANRRRARLVLHLRGCTSPLFLLSAALPGRRARARANDIAAARVAVGEPDDPDPGQASSIPTTWCTWRRHRQPRARHPRPTGCWPGGARDEAARLRPRPCRAASTRAMLLVRSGPADEAEGLGAARGGGARPRLSADYRHDQRTYHVVGLSSGSEVDYLRESPGDAVSVRLDWDLRGLVLGRDELAAVAAAERAQGLRRAAVERATKLYHQRLQAKVTLLGAPPESAAGRAPAELELAQQTAELHALTGLFGGEAERGRGRIRRDGPALRSRPDAGGSAGFRHAASTLAGAGWDGPARPHAGSRHGPGAHLGLRWALRARPVTSGDRHRAHRARLAR